MHRIDTDGHVANLFVEGTPQIGQQGTIMDAAWANAVQENICRVIEAVPTALVKGDHDQLKNAIAAMIAVAAANARVKPGVISAYGGAVAPSGHLECNGQVISRTVFADLFAAIGTTFGAGDGATTFAVPDLRGEFLRGWDNGRGVDAGRVRGSAQGHAIQAHTHTVPIRSNANTGSSFAEDADGTGTAADMNTGSTGGTETRPRNVALMYIIKI